MAYPVVASSVVGATTTQENSIDVSKPSGLAVGDLILVTVISEPNKGSAMGSGFWDLIGSSQSPAVALEVWAKEADSSDVSASTINIIQAQTTDFSYMAYSIRRITGWSGDINDVVGLTNSGSNTNTPYGPELTAPWGSADNLWIEVAGWLYDRAHLTYPTNYSSNQHTARYANEDAVGVASSTRNLTTATEAPGEHTITNDEPLKWSAATVVIRPPTVTSGSGTCSGVGVIIGAGRCERRGGGTCDGDGDPTGGGSTTRRGSGTCSGVGSVDGSGRCHRYGSGVVLGIGSLVGIGYQPKSGHGAVVGVGTLVGVGAGVKQGSGSVAAVGVIVGASANPRAGAGAVVGVGSLFGSGCKCLGSGSVVGVGSLVGVGAGVRQGSGTVAAVGVILGSSSLNKTGSGTVLGVGSLFGSGCKCLGSGVVSGVGVLFGSGAGVRQGSGSVVGVGVVVGAGASDQPTGSGVVLGVGTIVGSGAGAKQGSGAVVGVGTLVGVGKMPRSGAGAVVGVGVIVGAGASTQPNGSGTVLGVGSLVGTGQSIRSGSGLVVGVGLVVVGAGSVARSGSGAVVGVGVIVGAAFADAPEGAGAVVGVGVVVGAATNTKSGSGSVVGVGLVVGAASISPCTTGATDAIAGTVTVDDPTGFAVGQIVVIDDATEDGTWSWIAKITAIAGSVFTLVPPPDQTLPNIEICRRRGGWFGPGGEDCGCDCGSCGACEDAQRHFGDTQIELSGLAGAGSSLDCADITAWNCSLPDEAMQTWAFPGFSGGTLAIDDSDCGFGVESSIQIGTGEWGGGLPITGWGGTLVTGLPYFPSCGYRAALAAGRRRDNFFTMHTTSIEGVVSYSCRSNVPTRTVTIAGGYAVKYFQVFTLPNFTIEYPDWTWDIVSGASGLNRATGFYAAGGIEYTYRFTLITYGGIGGEVHQSRWYQISLDAQSTSATTIDLADAPAFFDPFNLLQGVVAVT